MKLTAELAGEKYELDVRRDGTRVLAEIDGRRYELEGRASQSGIYLLLADGQVYECRVDYPGTKRETAEVTVGTQPYAITLTDPKRLGSAHGSDSHSEGSSQIIAPMPGKVVRVLIEEGAEVEAGAGLLIVEAMKMQNEMKSPKAGRVTSINVAEGATVNAGDLLAVVE